MARTKKEEITLNTVTASLHKREMWVGLGVLFIVLIGAGVLVKNAVHVPQQDVQQTAVVSPIASPTATISAMAKGEATVSAQPVTGSASNMIGTSAVSQAEPVKVARLANTAGYYTVIAEKNDNFWKISKRVCGTGIYYEVIQRQNGYQYRSLQPGDVLTVYCS